VDKKLLLVNYYWPPSGGPAVQRWLSLTSELAELGWKIWVLTVDEKYATYQMYDYTFVDKIHPSVQVVKTKTIEPFGFYKLLFGQKSIPAPGFSNEANPSFTKKVFRFIRGNFFIPDPRKYWKSFAVKAASTLITNEEIKLVITAGPPHSTHFIGKSLNEKFGVKWVCDFHDLWTDAIYYNLLFHLAIVKKQDLNLERQILESCDKILTVGEKYKLKLLSKSAKVLPQKISLVRIGFEGSLFAEKDASASPYFTIAYIGSIAEYYQPEVFFAAVRHLVDSATSHDIRIRFVGIASPVIKQLINKYNLSSIYQEDGYQPHYEAVKAMKEATVLLLMNPVTKDESMVIPGKIYEYLAAGKPIINVTTKDSETALLITASKAGRTFERNEQTALQDYLLELYQQWQIDKLESFNPDKNRIEEYSRSSISKDLDKELLELI
jgi:glycosyltransferase involved in cell wall biosynthesis